MRILHVGKYYPPEVGGIETIVCEIVRGLRQLGNQVDVLCITDLPDQVGLHHDGYLGYVFKNRSYATFNSTSFSPGYIYNLRKIIDTYDVVSIHLPNPLPFFSLIGKNECPPLVIHWHADVSDYGFFYKFYSIADRYMLARSHAIIVATEGLASTSPSLRNDSKKIRVIPFGISTEYLMNNKNVSVKLLERAKEKKIVFSLGRFVSYKGFDVLIRAARFLDDGYIIIIGGDGPEYMRCKVLVNELGLSDRVMLPGKIPNNELGAYYNACSVFCLPSVSKAEAFGIVLIEAMSFAKPVISSKLNNGVDWVVGDNFSGLTFEVGNSKALADAITYIISDPVRYKLISTNAINRYSAEFTSTKMATRLHDLYEEISRK